MEVSKHSNRQGINEGGCVYLPILLSSSTDHTICYLQTILESHGESAFPEADSVVFLGSEGFLLLFGLI